MSAYTWLNFTTKLELIFKKNANQMQPRRPAHASVRCVPPRNTLCIFFETSPAKFLFWKLKRVFSGWCEFRRKPKLTASLVGKADNFVKEDVLCSLETRAH